MCKKIKPLDQFYTDKSGKNGKRSVCIICSSDVHYMSGVGTMKTRFNRSFRDAKYNAKRRGKIKGRNDNSSIFTITKADLHEMDHRQNSRCALSGMPLNFQSGDFTYSLDRIDPFKGYTPENCRWIIKELNGHNVDRSEN